MCQWSDTDMVRRYRLMEAEQGNVYGCAKSIVRYRALGR